MAPFDRLCTSSYCRDHSNSGPILCYFQEKARYWSKIVIFIPHTSDVPLWETLSQYCHEVWYRKLERCGYTTAKKSYDVFSCFDLIPACDMTERDRQTDRQTSCDSIVRTMHMHHA